MKILFVCSGNTCRSPMAMAIWRSLGGEARSAGLHAVPGARLAPEARGALAEMAVAAPDHVARGLDAKDVLWADWVLAMTAAQKDELVGRLPWAAPWVRTLAEVAGGGGDVADPVGQGPDAYRAVAARLRRDLADVAARLAPPEPWSLAAGSDHAGLRLKAALVDGLPSLHGGVLDVGTYDETSCDYPDYARLVAYAVAYGKSRLGLLVCGTGQGMAIAANKVAGCRAAAVSEPVSARLSREHNDANVLCLGARVVGEEVARACLAAFVESAFAGGRHARRVAKVRLLEEEADR